jgi:hypothetical protein
VQRELEEFKKFPYAGARLANASRLQLARSWSAFGLEYRRFTNTAAARIDKSPPHLSRSLPPAGLRLAPLLRSRGAESARLLDDGLRSSDVAVGRGTRRACAPHRDECVAGLRGRGSEPRGTPSSSACSAKSRCRFATTTADTE